MHIESLEKSNPSSSESRAEDVLFMVPVYSAVVVFTGKSLEHIINDGGSSSWVLDRARAKKQEYLVCCRSGVEWVEGPEPQGTAFLVGRVSDVVPSPENPERWLIKISAYARVNVEGAWPGLRNPVHYGELGQMKINPEKLTFEPVPKPQEPVFPELPPKGHAAAPLTIAEAKRGLSAAFGVPVEQIDITIRG